MNRYIYAGLMFFLSSSAVFANSFAYITNAQAPGSLSICEVNEVSGQFKRCEEAFVEQVSSPLDIAFVTVEEVPYAYITNSQYPAFVTHCQVESNGQLRACLLTDVPSYAGIAFNESDRLYAYLSVDDSIQKCVVGKNGQLAHQQCVDSGVGPLFTNGAMYITFKTFNGSPYAYIANGDVRHHANVMQCEIIFNGDFANCMDASVGTVLDGAADVDFAILSGKAYAYITQSGGAIAKCNVAVETGLLHNCATTGGEFAAPIGMMFKTFADTVYAYVVDGGFHTPPANAVSQCRVDVLGDLDCVDSGVGAVFANPFGIS